MHTEHLANVGPFHPFLNRPRWEKGKGCFLKRTTIVAGAPLLSTIYFGSRKLTASCFVDLVRLPSDNYCPTSLWAASQKIPGSCFVTFLILPSGNDCPSLLCAAFPTSEMKAFSYLRGIFQKGEHVMNSFQGT